MNIKSRLIFVIGFLSILLVGSGLQGLHSLSKSNDSLKTVYEDRLIALSQLDRYARLILRTQWGIALAASDTTADSGLAINRIQGLIDDTNKEWSDYKSTFLTENEKALALDLETARARLMSDAIQPALVALRANDRALAIDISHGKMTESFSQFQPAIKALIALQLEEARNEFEQGQQRYASTRAWSVTLIVAGVVIGLLMGWWLIRAIFIPLQQAIAAAKRVAAGDLSHTIDVTSKDETAELMQSLKDMTASLVRIVDEVRNGTDTIATGSAQIASGNLDLSSRTEQQASALEETASSMEELAATVKQNADNARQANQLAGAASQVALRGGEVVGQVVDTMESIKQSSSKIVEIISVIDGIAFQTNILALNAAVEAARAGEQGRGFAVVATEVRNLAQRSAAAAKEIKALIGDSVSKVDAGSALVAHAGSTMQEIVGSVRQVTDIMGEISAASEEQTSGIDQINQAVIEMDRVTQQNAALVEEAAAAAQSLQEQAGRLSQSVSVFNLGKQAPARVALLSM